MKEIAVFGGTFDPPTLAHERIIESCLELDGMNEVWVMPSGKRTDKPDMLDNKTRLEMLGAMREGSFDSNEQLVISDFEMNLPQPSKTIDTVLALEMAYPKDRFWFVFGADSYKTMHTWESGERLKQSLGMLLVAREGEVLPVERNNVRHLLVPGVVEMSVSSTKTREAISNGEPIDSFVSRSIAKYIEQNRCYN